MWRQSAVHNIGNTQPAVEEGLVFFFSFLLYERERKGVLFWWAVGSIESILMTSII